MDSNNKTIIKQINEPEIEEPLLVQAQISSILNSGGSLCKKIHCILEAKITLRGSKNKNRNDT